MVVAAGEGAPERPHAEKPIRSGPQRDAESDENAHDEQLCVDNPSQPREGKRGQLESEDDRTEREQPIDQCEWPKRQTHQSAVPDQFTNNDGEDCHE